MEATIPDRAKGTADEHRWPSLRASFGLVLWAAALRLPTLPLRRLVEGDGVHYAQLARSILAGDFSGLANPYWSNLWPALIAATSLVTGLDVVAAGRLAALFSGVLLVLAVATLATRLFGPTAGVVAGMLGAAHPWLIHFSTLVFTESFFALLVVSVLLVAPRAGRSTRAAAGGGLLAGLAVVTRPEAHAVVAAVLGGLALAEGVTRARLARLGLFASLVLLFVFGRAALVHRYHGYWDFGVGTKGTANLIVGLARDDRDRERISTEVDPNGHNLLAQRAGEATVLGFALAHPSVLIRHVGRNMAGLFASALRVFPFVPLVGGRPPLWSGEWPALLAVGAVMVSALASLGLVWACRAPTSRHTALLLLTTGVLYVLGLSPLLVHDRLVVSLVPLFLVFLAYGLVRSASILGSDLPARRILVGALAVLGVLSVIRLHQARALDYARDPPVQRETGEWLAAHYTQDVRLMTAAVSVGFYFYDAGHAGNELRLPWGDPQRVLALAREQGVTLLVLPDWHLRVVQHPAALLLDPASAPPALRHVVTLGEPARGSVIVYEIVAAGAHGSS